MSAKLQSWEYVLDCKCCKLIEGKFIIADDYVENNLTVKAE